MPFFRCTRAVVWAVLLFLAGSILITAGCVQPSSGDDPVLASATPADAAGNGTCTSDTCTAPAPDIRGLVARPAGSAIKSTTLQATPLPGAVLTNRAGPTLNAKGGVEVNITEVELAHETLQTE